MPMPPSYIVDLGGNTHWQATAEDKNGDRVVIMRGHQGARFDKDYYLHGGNAHLGLVAYSLNGIQRLFVSSDLKLLKGSVPNREDPALSDA